MVETPPPRTRPHPAFVEPQLPTLVAAPPDGDGWIHEIKYDGYRTQLVIDGGAVRALTRNGHDWTDRYPRVAAGARELHCRNAVIDGEAIVQDDAGVSDFAALRKALKAAPQRIVMFAFDLLFLDGEDLRSRPLVERRARLEGLLAGRPKSFPIHFSGSFEGSGEDLFGAVDRLGLEGIVSKRTGSRYRSGRSDAWLKTKCFQESTLEVIGLDRTRDGAVSALLAAHEGEELRYAGRAFVSLAGRERDRFYRALDGMAAERPPAGIRVKAALWTKPGVAVRVRHLKGEETLRHASLIGLAET
jgi:bifunctional non-homologous end joining protein LigD